MFTQVTTWPEPGGEEESQTLYMFFSKWDLNVTPPPLWADEYEQNTIYIRIKILIQPILLYNKYFSVSFFSRACDCGPRMVTGSSGRISALAKLCDAHPPWEAVSLSKHTCLRLGQGPGVTGSGSPVERHPWKGKQQGHNL